MRLEPRLERGGYFRYVDYLQGVDRADFLSGAVDGRAVVERTIAAAKLHRAPILHEPSDIALNTRAGGNLFFIELDEYTQIIGSEAGETCRFKCAPLAAGQIGILISARARHARLKNIGIRITGDVMVDSANAVVCQNAWYPEFDNFLVPNSGWRYGVLAIGSMRPRFYRMRALGTYAHSIEVNACWYWEIESCDLQNFGKSGVGAGIETYYVGGADLCFGGSVRNTVIDGGPDGIAGFGCEFTQIDDTIIRNCTNAGLSLSKDGVGPYSTNARVRNLTIEECVTAVRLNGSGHRLLDTIVKAGTAHSLIVQAAGSGMEFDGFTVTNPNDRAGGQTAIFGNDCLFKRMSFTNQGDAAGTSGIVTGFQVYGDDHEIEALTVTDARGVKRMTEALGWEAGAERNHIAQLTHNLAAGVVNRSGGGTNSGPP